MTDGGASDPTHASAALSAEALLLARYAGGDRDAARDLTQQFLPRAYGYALRLLSDRAEAEDVAQEAMLRLWRAASGWREGEARITTWLYRVVTNLATDRLRARQRRGRQVALDDAPDPPDPAPGVVAQLIRRDRADALQAALDSLPDRQREAVVLRHIEGLTNPEIALVLGVGVEAVESLTARGKRALASALQGRRDDLGYAEG